MFQKEFFIKYYVFRGMDVLALAIALILSNFLRFWEIRLFVHDRLYINVFAVSLIVCVAANIILKLDEGVFDRDAYQELMTVCKSTFCIWALMMGYLFMSQQGQYYSRLQSFYYIIIYFWASYIGRRMAKPAIIRYYKRSRSRKKIMLVTSADKAAEILEKFEETNNWYFEIRFITIVDRDMIGKEIQGIPVVANAETMLERVKDITLDGVFISVPYRVSALFDIRKTLRDFQEMGVIVHINIDVLELNVADKAIGNLGLFKVVSYASRLYEPGQLVLKRCMDILGGIVGLTLTFIAGIFVVPAICLESPGKPIYAQLRVGKNGRRFKMYKFRSMYADADKRKAELLEKNEMQGAMFKITDDPRITKVGKFIRKYSIDELPQFYNVLKGEMSLVGTRPPTVDELNAYKAEQKRRLSIVPGMTGVWQTSGRSEIYDFDEIVKLDLEYIDKWSIGLDIKLLLKTIVVCAKGSGAK